MEPGEPAFELAKTIVVCENLDFAGIMAYEGHTNAEAEFEADYERLCRDAMSTVQKVVELFEAEGISMDEVKVGSTGTSRYSGNHPVVPESNPEKYPFNDANVLSWNGPVKWDDCTLTMLTKVISKPNDDRVVDAGSKAMSMELDCQTIPKGRDDIVSVIASKEHGWIDTSEADEPLEVASRLDVTSSRTCVRRPISSRSSDCATASSRKRGLTRPERQESVNLPAATVVRQPRIRTASSSNRCLR